MKRILTSILLTLCIIGLTCCTTPQTQPMALNQTSGEPASVSTELPQANMPNPASIYCVEQGYKSEIRTAADGSHTGYCIFPEGNECDEWAYFRGECRPATALPSPKSVEEPLAIHHLSVPLPFAVLVNTDDQRGITAYDRSGPALGEWRTAQMTGQVHAAGAITDGVMFTPLVFCVWHVEDNNTIYEFLAADTIFNNLSVNQAYATWVQANSGDMQVTDLISGQTASFPERPESEHWAGLGMISPSAGYVAWEEGVNLVRGEQAPIISVRIGTMDGKIPAEYPQINFTKTSELGMKSSIKLLGWLSDETLLVGVHQYGKEGASLILALNVNANEITLFGHGEFAGFAYPSKSSL